MRKELKILKEGEEGYGVLIEKDSGYISLSDNVGLIKEDRSFNTSNGIITVNCILQRANTQNRNGRIYPKHILVRENDKYQELIRDRRALGEANHPDSISVSIGRDECTHNVLKTWWDGDVLYGTLQILVSPAFIASGIICNAADQIANYLRLDIRLGISSRGIGSLKNVRGQNIVQDDFELVCFDLVSSPSTPNAYLYFDKNMNESTNPNKAISPLNEKLNKFLKK